MSKELSLLRWKHIINNKPSEIIFNNNNNNFLITVLIILVLTCIYSPLIFLSILLLLIPNRINKRIDINNLHKILHKKNHYGYYTNNEIGSIIAKEDIENNELLINKLLKAWQNKDSKFINKILLKNLYGKIFMKHKNETNFRVLVNASSIIKIISRIFMESINTNIFPKNFLNFQMNEDKFVDCCKLAINHRLNKNQQFIQLDISKAFDNVDRDLLLESLKYHKINQFKINIVMNIVNNIKLKYNNQNIDHKRGILQGITFCNLLFGLVMKYIFDKIVQNIKSIYKFRHNRDYSMSIYVDDIIIRFYLKKKIKTSVKNITREIIDTLKYYNLPVNNNKSYGTLKIKPKFISPIKPTTKYLGMIYSKNKEIVFNYLNQDLLDSYNVDLYYVNELQTAINILNNQNINNISIDNIQNNQLRNYVNEFHNDNTKIDLIKELKLKTFGRLRYKIGNLYGCIGIRNKKDINHFLNKKKLNNLTEINIVEI